MPKYKLTIEYDGTNFVGWQIQDNGQSIQQSLQEAIKKLSNEQVTVFGAGRTDSGVHAKGQAAHFEISKDLTLDNIRDGINQYLRPLPIAILKVEKVTNDFNLWLSSNNNMDSEKYGRIKKFGSNVINYMNAEDWHDQWQSFLDYSNVLDKHHKTNLFNIYPEYK